MDFKLGLTEETRGAIFHLLPKLRSNQKLPKFKVNKIQFEINISAPFYPSETNLSLPSRFETTLSYFTQTDTLCF